jgi:hypothetical protein
VFEYDNEDNPVRWVQFPVGKHGMSKDRWSLYRRDHGGWRFILVLLSPTLIYLRTGWWFAVGSRWEDGEFEVYKSQWYDWCVSWEEPGVAPAWFRILPKHWRVVCCG